MENYVELKCQGKTHYALMCEWIMTLLFYIWPSALHEGNRKWPHNCDSLSSPSPLNPKSESPPCSFSQPTMWCQRQDTSQRSTVSLSKVKHLRLWFRNTVTFPFPASISIPPFCPHWSIHHADRQCVLSTAIGCSSDTEQPIWEEGEVDKGG